MSLDPPNILFLVSIAVGVFLMLITACTGIGDGSDTDADADHDVCTDHDHSYDAADRALALLGVGRMPVVLALTMLMLLFGSTGFVLHVICTRIGLSPGASGLISATLGVVSAVLLTRTAAQLFARVVPRTESYSTTKEMMIGCRGTAVFTITESGGMAQVRDLGNDLQKIAARTRNGEVVPMGCLVEVLSYEKDDKYFVVTSVAEARP